MRRFNSIGLLLLIAFSYCLIQGSFYPFLVLGFSFLHESGHIFAIWLLGGRLSRLTGHGQGLEIHFSGLTYRNEFFAAFAGPLTNLLLAGVLLPFLSITESKLLPYCFYANLLLAVLNLLPIFPLDGGRMLSCILAYRMDPILKNKVLQIIGLLSLLIMMGFAFWQFLISGYNFSLLFICLYLAVLIAAQSKGAYHDV